LIDIGSDFVMAWVNQTTDKLTFEQLKEAFGHGAVMQLPRRLVLNTRL
jgi:hypothetical protein